MFSSAAGSCWNAGGQQMSGVEAERVVTCSGKRRGRAEVGWWDRGIEHGILQQKGVLPLRLPSSKASRAAEAVCLD